MTERDTINNMSNMELAVFLKALADGNITKCDLCAYHNDYCIEKTCFVGILEFLKKEVVVCEDSTN